MENGYAWCTALLPLHGPFKLMEMYKICNNGNVQCYGANDDDNDDIGNI